MVDINVIAVKLEELSDFIRPGDVIQVPGDAIRGWETWSRCRETKARDFKAASRD